MVGFIRRNVGADDDYPSLGSQITSSGVSIPFDVEHTITFPSLTHLNILASPQDGALSLTHLHLPILAQLIVITSTR